MKRLLKKCLVAIALLTAMFPVHAFADNPAPKTGGTPGDSGTTSLAWKLGSPVSPWNLSQDRWAEVTVTVPQKSSITRVHLSQSTLVDSSSASSGVLQTNYIHLCSQRVDSDSGAKSCGTSLTIEPGDQARKETVWLYVDQQFKKVGTFTGNLSFDTGPLSDTQSINLTVQQTWRYWQLLGVVVIIVGVAVAWIVTVFARSRIARDQALLPALLLSQKLDSLQCAIDQFPSNFKSQLAASTAAIQQLRKSLSEQSLDNSNFLPPAIPAVGPSVTNTTAYQAFLTSTSTKVDDLDIIVSEGLSALSARWNPDLVPPGSALLDAIRKVDALSSNLPVDAQTLRSQIAAAFLALNAARNQALAFGEGQIQPGAAATKSVFAVRLEVQTITVLFWVVWGVLSVVIGATVLILPSPGFGSLTDFVRCFLWGFGLPVAGNSIQSLTTSSLNTQLGVSIARS